MCWKVNGILDVLRYSYRGKKTGSVGKKLKAWENCNFLLCISRLAEFFMTHMNPGPFAVISQKKFRQLFSFLMAEWAWEKKSYRGKKGFFQFYTGTINFFLWTNYNFFGQHNKTFQTKKSGGPHLERFRRKIQNGRQHGSQN